MLHNLNYITIFVPVERVITYNQYRYDSSGKKISSCNK